MRINSFEIDESTCATKGLKPVKLEKLSSVVALVGKNGSGKSRFLKLMPEYLLNNISFVNFLDGTISYPPSRIEQSLSKIRQYRDVILANEKIITLSNAFRTNRNNPDYKSQLQAAREEHQQQLNKLFPTPSAAQKRTQQTSMNQAIEQAKKEIKKEYYEKIFITIQNEDIIKLKRSFDKASDKNFVSFEEMIEYTKDDTELDELAITLHKGLEFLSNLSKQYIYDMVECKEDEKKIVNRISYKRYSLLKKLFQDFLKKELRIDYGVKNQNMIEDVVNVQYSGHMLVNDRIFNYDEFSDGEKLIIAYILIFFSIEQKPNTKIKESIIIIDEPELHLHPDAEIDIIAGIRDYIKYKGQLWIATHSINILSHLNYNEIYMLKDGEITGPSSLIQRNSLSELMKLDDRVEKLSEFLTSISEWSYVHFMTQCLNDPEVIENVNKDDPQVQAFIKALKSKGKNIATLLDFGAGSGRLFEGYKLNTDNIQNRIKYSALEIDKNLHPKLKEKGISEVYSEYKKLPDNSFDFIVLCNVLHEIPILEWIPNLNKIISSLKADGYLIIIEAKTLSVGEKIGRIGFLVLDNDELKELFSMEKLPSNLILKEDQSKVLCTVLKRKDINPIDETTLLKALDKLEVNSLEKIVILRDNPNDIDDSKIGRQLAFLSQLHINSKLAIKEIKTN
jgi:ABC-type cobalamin/Fe3+-siderophores transport system ATPase subunit